MIFAKLLVFTLHLNPVDAEEIEKSIGGGGAFSKRCHEMARLRQGTTQKSLLKTSENTHSTHLKACDIARYVT